MRWLACVSLLAACQSEPASRTVVIPGKVERATKTPTPKRESPPDDISSITLERTVCYGSCPAYRVTLEADGTVSYEGGSYVRERGPKKKQISAGEFQALVVRFESSEFETMTGPPWKCPPVFVETSDQPTATLTLRRKAHEHRIEHYLGDGCAPKVLGELEDAVDKTADVQEWVRCPPDGWCPNP